MNKNFVYWFCSFLLFFITIKFTTLFALMTVGLWVALISKEVPTTMIGQYNLLMNYGTLAAIYGSIIGVLIYKKLRVNRKLKK